MSLSMEFYPNRMLVFVKNVPAIHAVSKQARVAAIKALNATFEMAAVRFGANAVIPPTKIAMDATWAKPQRA